MNRGKEKFEKTCVGNVYKDLNSGSYFLIVSQSLLENVIDVKSITIKDTITNEEFKISAIEFITRFYSSKDKFLKVLGWGCMSNECKNHITCDDCMYLKGKLGE